MKDKIICPLCGADVYLTKTEGETFVWKCQPCPFIGFEYWQEKDYINLKKVII